MHKLFRIRGNGFILFDRFWLYGFRKSGFSVAARVGANEWRLVR